MFDYRIFYPQLGIEDQQRGRRPMLGSAAQRVFRLDAERRAQRRTGRR